MCYNFCSVVLPLVKKNYARLRDCLPQDYMMTIEKLRQLKGKEVPEKLVEYFTTFPTGDLANEAIVGTILMGILKSDSSILNVCDTMEYLAKNESSKSFIEKLRNGNVK